MVFSQPQTLWHAGLWRTDAEFLYWGTSAGRQMVICCNATYVEYGAHKIMVSARPVLRCEIISDAGKLDVRCSDPDATVNADVLRELFSDDATVLTDSSPEPQGTAS